MASTPILPFAPWLAGTNQNSIPANDNALRGQILNGNVISQAVTAQPATPVDGDAYIIAATHTGAQWAGFTPKDLAIFKGGTWLAFAPVEGVRVSIAGEVYVYTSGAWTDSSGGFVNPMNSEGDLIVGDVAGVPIALPLGTNGQILTSDGPGFSASWHDFPGIVKIVFSEVGDLVVYGASSTPTRLPAGASGYVLTSNGASTEPTWQMPAGGLTNPMTATGDVIIGGTSGIPTRLAASTNGYVLTLASGAPTWAAASGGFSNPMTSPGDLIIGGTSGAPSRLAAGTTAYVLTSNGSGTAPTWQAAPGGGGGGGGGTPNVQAVTSSSTVTPTFSNDAVKITAQAVALTLANPSGTAVDSWGISIRIKDNGTGRAISYGTQYRAVGVTLPTTTVVGKTLYLGGIWNVEDTKFDIVSVGQQA